ncbi:MAG TPA: hypothetical protein VK540_00740 [Polyangiaceae bacterium]|jgi:hypothetical protein|nr:hypothetical protein [Polyangiaceae bacterium]
MKAKDKASHPGTKRRVVAESASWLALVAATSLGIPHAETVRAEIKLPPEAFESGGRYRLIVQSYDTLGRASLIPSGRPRASTQRTVTPADLVDGVRIDLIELGDTEASPERRVIAWVEPGEADLEFDARRAKPMPGSFYGVAPSGNEAREAIEIVLDRRVRPV